MKTLALLTIGNSFSDDATEYLPQIARSLAFEKIELGNLYIGGCSLKTHLDNARTGAAAYELRLSDGGEWHTRPASLSDGIAAGDWQFISMQQYSGHSGKAETYDVLPALLDFVKGRIRGEKTRFVWHMTWAYPSFSEHPDFVLYGKNRHTMYEAILSAVKGKVLPLKDISALIPTGTAIHYARDGYFGDVLNRDVCHLSDPLGRYIAALTVIEALTDALSAERDREERKLGRTARRNEQQIAGDAVSSDEEKDGWIKELFSPAGISPTEKREAVYVAVRACEEPFPNAENVSF